MITNMVKTGTKKEQYIINKISRMAIMNYLSEPIYLVLVSKVWKIVGSESHCTSPFVHRIRKDRAKRSMSRVLF